MVSHLNLSQITIDEMETEDIDMTVLHSSPRSLRSNNSHQVLIADQEAHQPHILLPGHYPVYVEPMSRFDPRSEWVVVGEPIERIGMGVEVFGIHDDLVIVLLS